MRPLNKFVEQMLPSALAFAIALTLVVAVLALVFTPASPADIVQGWGDGLSGLLSFMTQMALVLLLGTMLASTRPVRAFLKRLARIPRSALSAYVFVFLIAAAGNLLTWGLGLMAGGLLARYVAVEADRRGMPVSFPMLVASAYSGFVVWHMGYSGSAPLTAATEGSFITEILGGVVPLGKTMFAWWNIATAGVAIVVIALTLYFIAPRHVPAEHRVAAEVIEAAGEEAPEFVPQTAADRIDASRILTLALGVALVAYLIIHFLRGGALTLDIVNWMFLGLVSLMVKNIHEFLGLLKNAAALVGDILVQFPLYAGIMGIMTASGLIGVLSDSILAVATPATLGFLGFLSAGIVNFFVPSGGGQLAVQGPVLLQAAQDLGVDPAIPIMAIAYGDQWTNMIQPFWALPLLAIAGLHIRDILGYTTAVLLASGVVFGGSMLLVGAMG